MVRDAVEGVRPSAGVEAQGQHATGGSADGVCWAEALGLGLDLVEIRQLLSWRWTL
jgi:hypothetical protein